MEINWYPGHMARAKRLLADQLRRVDVVLELCDARLPWSSRNPDLNQMLRCKARLGDRAKMSWPYHVGHLYQCLRDCIVARFGEAAQPLLDQALKQFAVQFGKQALALVFEYADMDYGKLTDYEPMPKRMPR